MSKVENGKSVIVHYTGRFEDGTVFDTSLTEGREPINTVLGQGSLIKGFEEGLIGMNEGEKKTIEVSVALSTTRYDLNSEEGIKGCTHRLNEEIFLPKIILI